MAFFGDDFQVAAVFNYGLKATDEGVERGAGVFLFRPEGLADFGYRELVVGAAEEHFHELLLQGREVQGLAEVVVEVVGMRVVGQGTEGGQFRARAAAYAEAASSPHEAQQQEHEGQALVGHAEYGGLRAVGIGSDAQGGLTGIGYHGVAAHGVARLEPRAVGQVDFGLQGRSVEELAVGIERVGRDGADVLLLYGAGQGLVEVVNDGGLGDFIAAPAGGDGRHEQRQKYGNGKIRFHLTDFFSLGLSFCKDSERRIQKSQAGLRFFVEPPPVLSKIGEWKRAGKDLYFKRCQKTAVFLFCSSRQLR